MANAKKDENGRNSIITASSANGTDILRAVADPITHVLHVEDGTSGSDNGNNLDNAMLDENSVPVWTALASDGSGRIIEVYGNPLDGAILTKST